ncbi:hypothetical protein BDD12DRAFT_506439 [Trichophaea hybrida]|nr:hypothetical protein BDD12DRAFT_506439 [Trichophaea hybrida]
MSSVVTDLESALQAMQNTKPPGVSGSKISLITELSVNNVQSESVIIQKLYTHFKKCPGTHKLGPLYVVDSIARKYLDQAKKNHQEVSAAAPDGTFAAGVFRITNLLPPLMNDILQHAPPEENKDKIEKLYAIWERSSTFPPEVLADVKKKMLASPMFQLQNQSSTPPGSPPRYLQTTFSQQQQHPSQPPPQQQTQNQVPPPQPQNSSSTDVASMLQAIAQMAKQSQNAVATPVNPPAPEQTPISTPVLPQYNAASSQPAASQPPIALPPTAPLSLPYTSTPPNTNGHPAFQGQMTNAYPMYQQNQVQPQTGYPQYNAPQQTPQQPQQQFGMEQIALLQLLLQQPGLQTTPQQLAPTIQALLGAAGQGLQMPNMGDVMQQQFWPGSGGMPQPQVSSEAPRASDGYTHEQRGRERGYSPPPRSPPRYSGVRRGRTRSRSPTRFGRDEPRSPPNFRRRSPVYGEYEGNNDATRSGGMISGGAGGDRGRGGGRGRGRRGGSPNRRDRSPPGRNAGAQVSPPPPRDTTLPKVPKNVTFVSDIGPSSVRVLSRTLFVGGVTIGDDELRQLFENFGQVQSCIVNQDKRHAFIKMLTREDAVKAKAGMETYKTDNMTLRTRWGVGFGPRDCSDYQTGISVIPIDRLTEADQRWMVSAEYGGTGGQPLQGGMCVEEPDIEIGQGVSSKGLSEPILLLFLYACLQSARHKLLATGLSLPVYINSLPLFYPSIRSKS